MRGPRRYPSWLEPFRALEVEVRGSVMLTGMKTGWRSMQTGGLFIWPGPEGVESGRVGKVVGFVEHEKHPSSVSVGDVLPGRGEEAKRA